MKKYNLTSNQSDRINFDEMVSRWAYQDAKENTGLFVDETWKQFNIDEVDDVEEAEVRFRTIYPTVYKHTALNLLCDELENIEDAVIVYDTGSEVFGEFANGQEAIKAIRHSNLNWWVMQENPSFEIK